MAKQSTLGRKQDRARVVGGQSTKSAMCQEVRKIGQQVKRAVKKVGTSRKKVERELGLG